MFQSTFIWTNGPEGSSFPKVCNYFPPMEGSSSPEVCQRFPLNEGLFPPELSLARAHFPRRNASYSYDDCSLGIDFNSGRIVQHLHLRERPPFSSKSAIGDPSFTPPPFPPLTIPFEGQSGCMKEGGGRIAFHWGGPLTYTPAPPSQKCLRARHWGKGGGGRGFLSYM